MCHHRKALGRSVVEMPREKSAACIWLNLRHLRQMNLERRTNDDPIMKFRHKGIHPLHYKRPWLLRSR
jgi:hypothetical protein